MNDDDRKPPAVMSSAEIAELERSPTQPPPARTDTRGNGEHDDSAVARMYAADQRDRSEKHNATVLRAIAALEESISDKLGDMAQRVERVETHLQGTSQRNGLLHSADQARGAAVQAQLNSLQALEEVRATRAEVAALRASFGAGETRRVRKPPPAKRRRAR